MMSEEDFIKEAQIMTWDYYFDLKWSFFTALFINAFPFQWA